MSLFLGKIHFWLYDKIQWFEGLEEETIELARAKSLDIDTLIREANDRFGKKLNNEPLENIIDEGNIHGWLQNAINAAEGRVAFYTTNLLSLRAESKKELKEIYSKKGIENAKVYLKNNENITSAEEIYKGMNDFILEGMPCDRINQVTKLERDVVEWSASRCLHKDFWEAIGGDVQNFYDLRNEWIKSFVSGLNNNFEYRTGNGVMAILRKNN